MKIQEDDIFETNIDKVYFIDGPLENQFSIKDVPLGYFAIFRIDDKELACYQRQENGFIFVSKKTQKELLKEYNE